MTLENPSSIPPSRPSPISKISIAYIKKTSQSILLEILGTPLICIEFQRKLWQNNAYKITGTYNWIGFWKNNCIVGFLEQLNLYNSLKTLKLDCVFWISEFFYGLLTYQESCVQIIKKLKFWESLTICENKLYFRRNSSRAKTPH